MCIGLGREGSRQQGSHQGQIAQGLVACSGFTLSEIRSHWRIRSRRVTGSGFRLYKLQLEGEGDDEKWSDHDVF